MERTPSQQTPLSNFKGWVTAFPLENYSSLHELSPLGFLGLNIPWSKMHFFVQFSFNLHTPLKFHPDAYLTFQTLDADQPSSPQCCYSITQFKRWRLNIASYSTFEEYLNSQIRWHRCNYEKSQKIFKNYGASVTFENDWTKHVDAVYRLYVNVAQKYSDKLYDLNFFKAAAQRPDYKLICAWFEGHLIGLFVLQEELPTLHSICCGFDYDHSSKCYAYSWLHYELIRWAIDSKKYQDVDIGLTADHSKEMIGFKPISARMDIYAKGPITRGLLHAASSLITAKITPESKLKLGFR